MDPLKGIKNIIFDWGGVIINISYPSTRQAFIDMGMKDFDEHFSQFRQTEIFNRLDIGKASGEEFFEAIIREIPQEVSMEEVRNAWNAMLQDFPEENYELLKRLKGQYRTFLYSNTNEPHLEYYFARLKKQYGIDSMDPLFEKAYYSCRFGMRKPDKESFIKILEENNLIPEETLFIDDTLMHVEGARKAGINAIHLAPPARLTSLFNHP